LEDDAKRRQQRKGAELWRGINLENAQVWKEHQKPTEAWAARYGDAYQLAIDFLKESEVEEEKQRRENERAHRRELEQARERAEFQRTLAAEQARSTRLFKLIAVAIGVLLLVAITVAIYAFSVQRKAVAAQRVAVINQALHFLAVSQIFIETRPTLSVLLSIEGMNSMGEVKAPFMPAAEEALRNAITKIAGTALVGHEGAVSGVAFSPDGRMLATASADTTMRLWSLSDPTAEPQVLRGHTDRVSGVAFSPDGQTLATASADTTVRLWWLSEPTAEPQVLRGHTATVSGVAFSPDGQRLATASVDRTVRLWSIKIEDLIQIACRLTGSNFSHEDWSYIWPTNPIEEHARIGHYIQVSLKLFRDR
jgi:hypothetical protein